MQDQDKIRLVCVDDNAEILGAMSLLFDGSNGIESVACLEHTRDLQPVITEKKPHVVAVDYWMPGQDALSAMRDAKVRFPDVQFLVLSADDSQEHVDRAFTCGATGYALKDGNFEQLAAAIRTVAAGDSWRPSGGMRRLA
ncbi:MAG TPA: response regulator transcription factor [Candidatus Krumholzibacteria bacterium]